MSESEVPDKVQSTPAKDLGEKESENFLTRKRILIADDDLEVGVMMTRLLPYWGASEKDMVIVNNGRKAWESYQAGVASGNLFDLVISDDQMPGITGTDLVAKVREHESGLGEDHPQLPVLLLSAVTEAEIGTLIPEGAVGVEAMVKPLDFDDLESKLRSMVSREEPGS